MAYPQGYLYQPSASLALYSCPAYSAGVISGPRTEELGRSSSGSAFAPYAGSTAFTGASPSYGSHLPYAADAAAAAATFSSYVGSPYDHTTGMAGSIGYHPYAAPLGSYPYGDPAYRKNATRDATATLKAWLNEHRKNPYPTKGEKIMLAIITKMTLTQVSTWFANARRRLKKENKMTWSPKNKGGEDRKDDLEKSDLDCVTKDSSDFKEKDLHLSDLDDMEDEDCDKMDSDCEKGPSEEQDLHRAMAVSGAPAKGDRGSELPLSLHPGFHPFPCGVKSVTSLPGLPSDFLDSVALKPLSSTTTTSSSSSSSSSCGPPGALSLSHYESSDKPRIWSLARTAASGVILSSHPGAVLSPHPGAEGRHPGGDCQLHGSRPPQAPAVACRGGTGGGGLHASSHATNAENPFQEGPPLHPKLYGAGGYGHKALGLPCSAFPSLQDACQFASIEGFAGVKAETDSPDLSRACASLQEDKVTAFRAVMKR